MEKEVKLFIQASTSEPLISFSEGILKMSGRSIPIGISKNFNQLIEAFYRYSRNPRPRTEIHIDLEYINSASNRSLLNLLIIAEYLFKEGFNVEVNWYYYEKDDIMFEQGCIFSELLSLPLKLSQK
jgi:hypothetical protein